MAAWRRGPGVVALALALALIVSSVATDGARADAAAEARFFDGMARAQFAARHYDRALALFLESHRAAPSPGALYNIGVTAMLAHEEALAYTHLDEFLASGTHDAVRRDDATRRMAEMEGRLSRVRVETDPPGATITVDRDELGALGHTPRTIVVEPGHHVVTVALAGHEAATGEVDATLGTLASVSRTLAAILGTVELSVTPPSARVVARAEDGTEIASTDASTPMRLPLGRHALHIEAPGFVAVDREVVVREDASSALRVILEAIPVPTGRLLVDTGAIAARVLVDGTARASTPARVSLEVGPHRVRVEADGYRPWEGDVEIAEGRARFVDLVLVAAE